MATAMEIDSASTTPSRAITLDSDTTGTAADPNDPDPIVASYEVYANPSLPENRKLVVLQHPNMQGSKGRLAYRGLGEVRLKGKAGFLEVDVPIPHGQSDYDRDKGLRWGSALARSVAAKNGGTHGLAGGFGVGVPTRAGGGAGRGGGGKRPDDLEHELSMLDWSEAVRQDKVLRTQTLGGQFATNKETNCRWAVGVFKGDKLYLTPAASVIHLRPQYHHLDAWTEQERLSRPREGAAAAGPGSGPGAAGKEGGAAAGPSQGGAAAKAIHMSIKSAGTEGGEASIDTMVERLRKVQVEPWTKLKYEDDESDRAWHMFNDHLASAKPDSTQDDPKDKNKGKGKEKEDEKAPKRKYKSQWTENEFLQAVSGLKDNQQGDTKPQDDEVEIKAEVINPTPARAGTAKGKGRAVGGPAAAPATKRSTGARGKSVAFKE